jgi:hypothetical protein
MGCNAAFNALKLARHVVRSDRRARVLVVSLELCTLHLQETDDLERALSFLIFADGCAAALVSAEPRGLELERFASAMLREGADLITWRIGADGFDMHLSGEVPATLGRMLPAHAHALAGQRPRDEIAHWAVHPGGRSILDAVEDALELGPEALGPSRAVLRDFGNMSSATVMFVLRASCARAARARGSPSASAPASASRAWPSGSARPDDGAAAGRSGARARAHGPRGGRARGPRARAARPGAADRLGPGAPPGAGLARRIAKGRETLSVLDVGSGGGDALRRIARWAAGAGLAVELEGVDLNPTARVVAQAATDPVLPIRFRTADVFDLDRRSGGT